MNKQDQLWEKIAQSEEEEYVIRASKRMFKTEQKIIKTENEDFIGMNDNKGDTDEIEKLRTENKRLKRTLMERFDETFN